MTLTSARGPLGNDPAGWFSAPLPPDIVFVEPHPRRIEARVDGRTVIDTERALMVHRAGWPPRYAFPPEAVAELPNEPAEEALGFAYVAWDAVDEWFEEGRKLVHYPPNPYHRVDYHPTSRRLRVEVAGTVLVDTTDTVIVFETALAPKLYVDRAAVRTDLLRRSGTTTYCNYKGHSTYWSAVIGDSVVEDVAWSYENPLPESAPIQGMISFDADRAEVLAELPAGSERAPASCDTECAVPVR
jgi:uncharacterized protein (DUF427 family)